MEENSSWAGALNTQPGRIIFFSSPQKSYTDLRHKAVKPEFIKLFDRFWSANKPHQHLAGGGFLV